MDLHSITPDTCIVRNTAAAKGRTLAIAPGRTPASRHLHYGRIILDAVDAPMTIGSGLNETGLICLNGSATATVDGTSYSLGRYDALYVPREASVSIAPGPHGCDLAEIAAPVSKRHPVQYVRFADVQAEPWPALQRRRRLVEARSQRADRQERRGGPDHGRRHLQRTRQLDVVAAARTRRDARRGLSLHRHAGAGVRHSAGLHQCRASRSWRRSSAKATS